MERIEERVGERIATRTGRRGAPSPPADWYTGTWGHGNVVSLHGSGFGAHADYNDINSQWKGQTHLVKRFTDADFPGGEWPTSGSTYFANPQNWHGFYPQGGGAYWSDWTTRGLGRFNGGVSQSNWYWRRWYVDIEGRGVSMVNDSAVDATNLLYMRHKFAFNTRGTAGQSDGKWDRIWDNGSNTWQHLNSECGSSSARPRIITGSGDVSSSMTFAYNTWHSIEFTFTPVSGDPAIHWWVDHYDEGQHPRRNVPNGLSGRTIDVPNMIDAGFRCPCCPGGDYSYTDVFINYTPARVEISDESVWNWTPSLGALPSREIQIPSSWSDTDIDIVVNQGEHASLSGRWVYVVDENENVQQLGQIP